MTTFAIFAKNRHGVLVTRVVESRDKISARAKFRRQEPDKTIVKIVRA